MPISQATPASLNSATTARVQLIDVGYDIQGRTIFDGLNVTMERGKITAVMGPSGTGKTTLLRMIAGQIKPTRGRVLVDGIDIGTLDVDGLFALRRGMGMLFQNGALLTDLDVYENVAFPLREHTNLPESLIARIVLMKLHAVGLRGAARLMPAELSGGMARRVALARAIVMDPLLLIYDEPFAGLDPIGLGVVLRLIRDTNDSLALTSVVVSHDVDEIGLLADTAYILADGRVAASGKPADLRKDDAPIVRQFMGGIADGPVAFHYPAPNYDAQLLAQDVPI